MTLCQCKNCGEFFSSSQGGKPLFCQKPECQQKKDERRKSMMRKLSKERRKKIKANIVDDLRGMENWIPAKTGKCEKCGDTKRLNRWGLCSVCYAKASQDRCDGDWVYAIPERRPNTYTW